jgi:hypothetical protein
MSDERGRGQQRGSSRVKETHLTQGLGDGIKGVGLHGIDLLSQFQDLFLLFVFHFTEISIPIGGFWRY